MGEIKRQRDPITFESASVTDEQLHLMQELKTAFYAVTAILERLPESRYRSVAETNIEQAAMWANKAVSHGPV